MRLDRLLFVPGGQFEGFPLGQVGVGELVADAGEVRFATAGTGTVSFVELIKP
jgi:hypothetical protein